MWDMKSKWMIFILALAGISCAGTLSLEESLAPYQGPVQQGIDHSTLHGTVMCGYQGWFSHEEDGNDLGNVHWGPVKRDPPRCSVDLWPDLSELTPEEKFPTNYKHADGSTASCVQLHSQAHRAAPFSVDARLRYRRGLGSTVCQPA